MAVEQNLYTITVPAKVDLSACQYHCVRLSGSNTVDLAQAANAADGVLLNKPEAGEPATFAILGICPVKTGANVSAGDFLQSNDSGHAIVCTASFTIGKALTAGTSGDVVSVLLCPHGVSSSLEA